MRLAYLGTPATAVPTLRALVGAGHDVVMVVSRVDKRRSRGGALQPSPVKEAAQELGLTVTDNVDDLLGAEVGAELGVVVAYGRLIRPHVLAALPMVNVHFSLLPRWRGAAPVERAVLAGDEVTGVCVMGLEEGLDTGPVYARREVPIGADQHADELRSELVDVGTALLVDLLEAGLPEPQPQVGVPTYAAKIEPGERQVDWTAGAVAVHRVVRIGRAWTTFRGRRLGLRAVGLGPSDSGLAVGQIDAPRLLVGTGGGGSVLLIEVQPEARNPLDAGAWRNGARLTEADRLV